MTTLQDPHPPTVRKTAIPAVFRAVFDGGGDPGVVEGEGREEKEPGSVSLVFFFYSYASVGKEKEKWMERRTFPSVFLCFLSIFVVPPFLSETHSMGIGSFRRTTMNEFTKAKLEASLEIRARLIHRDRAFRSSFACRMERVQDKRGITRGIPRI